MKIFGGFSMYWPFPIASMLHSSEAVVFGSRVFRNQARWIKLPYRMFCSISDAKYWCKYRMFPTRYHWVDTGLRPGYHDPDETMLYAAMSCLGRYIKEMGGTDEIDKFNTKLRDPKSHNVNAAGFMNQEVGIQENAQAARQNEAATIWRWWTVERPADQKRHKDLLMYLYGSDKKRVSWKPAGNDLMEAVIRPFEGEEETLHNEFRQLEDKIEEDEQKMLHRLVEIRESLWT